MAGSVKAFIQSVVNDLLRGAMSDKVGAMPLSYIACREYQLRPVTWN
jgi:hypothetical protein